MNYYDGYISKYSNGYANMNGYIHGHINSGYMK